MTEVVLKKNEFVISLGENVDIGKLLSGKEGVELLISNPHRERGDLVQFKFIEKLISALVGMAKESIIKKLN